MVNGIRTRTVNKSKQELLEELGTKLENKEISKVEIASFLVGRTKRCDLCGQKIEIKPKITNLEIHKDKLIAHLNNGQKPTIPISWFAKWGVKGVSTDKLKDYEIWDGDEIYFPKIDEVLGIEVFIHGFNASCE